MDINYEIKNCPHCNSNDIGVLGNENTCYGLVCIKTDNDQVTPNLNNFIPVVATVCRNCGHVELIHINSKTVPKR